MSTSTTASTTASQLRTALRFVEAHPDLPSAHVSIYTSGTIDFAWYLDDDDDQVEQARRIRRAIGGTWAKSASDTTLYLRQQHARLGLVISCARDVACVRKVVGHEDVTIPAVDAQPERVVRREVVEWDCGPILGVDLTKAEVSA